MVFEFSFPFKNVFNGEILIILNSAWFEHIELFVINDFELILLLLFIIVDG